jgi:hypothetical protein
MPVARATKLQQCAQRMAGINDSNPCVCMLMLNFSGEIGIAVQQAPLTFVLNSFRSNSNELTLGRARPTFM